MASPAATELRDIARRLARLQQDWANPCRYHDRRDTLAEEIVAIAGMLDAPCSGARR